MNENAKSGRDPFLVPGRTDAYMFPALGSLTLKKIVSMPTQDVEDRLRQHLRGKSPFINPELYSDDPDKRIRTSKIFLAVLEGVPIGGRSFEEWIDEIRSHDGELLSSVRNFISVLIARQGSDAYKKRLAEVTRELMPEARVLRPSKKELTILRGINTVLREYGFLQLTVGEILAHRRIHGDASENKGDRTVWDNENLLKLFRLSLDGTLTSATLAERFGTSESSLSAIRSMRLTPKAKSLIQQIRKFKR